MIGRNKTGFVRVAAGCPRICPGEPGRNAAEICALVDAARAEGADLLVLPELAVTGYTAGDLFVRAALLSEAEAGLEAVRAHLERDADGLIVAVGAPVRLGGRLFNCAVFLQDGRPLAVVPKSHLPGYQEFYEPRWFSPASEAAADEVEILGARVPFGTDLIVESPSGLAIAAEICEDLWVAAPPAGAAAAAGANVIVNLSASNETTGKADFRRRLVAMQSARLSCGYVYASSGAGESTTDLVFSGHLLTAQGGRIAAESIWRTGLVTALLDLERIELERIRFRTFAQGAEVRPMRRVAAAPTRSALTELWPETVDPTPFIPKSAERRRERATEILNMQSAGLAERLRKTGIPRVVIGVSGGLDSTLALLVAARAVDMIGRPRSSILGISMPGFGTSARTRGSADALMAALGIESRTIDIREACRAHFRDIGHPEDRYDVVFENVQARERTQILMDVANAEGGLVLGTSDMSELALGWATFNGDHMSMYGVNAGVPKTLVQHLVRTCGEMEPELAGVLEAVLSTEISPELLPPDAEGRIQSTESAIGPYVLHDFFLYHLMRSGFARAKIERLARIAFPETDPELIARTAQNFFRRFYAQQYKRSSLPDGPKIGSVALSPRGDLRLPSDLGRIEG